MTIEFQKPREYQPGLVQYQLRCEGRRAGTVYRVGSPRARGYFIADISYGGVAGIRSRGRGSTPLMAVRDALREARAKHEIREELLTMLFRAAIDDACQSPETATETSAPSARGNAGGVCLTHQA